MTRGYFGLDKGLGLFDSVINGMKKEKLIANKKYNLKRLLIIYHDNNGQKKIFEHYCCDYYFDKEFGDLVVTKILFNPNANISIMRFPHGEVVHEVITDYMYVDSMFQISMQAEKMIAPIVGNALNKSERVYGDRIFTRG